MIDRHSFKRARQVPRSNVTLAATGAESVRLGGALLRLDLDFDLKYKWQWSHNISADISQLMHH